mgnify:CR=1 FL=1
MNRARLNRACTIDYCIPCFLLRLHHNCRLLVILLFVTFFLLRCCILGLRCQVHLHEINHRNGASAHRTLCAVRPWTFDELNHALFAECMHALRDGGLFRFTQAQRTCHALTVHQCIERRIPRGMKSLAVISIMLSMSR